MVRHKETGEVKKRAAALRGSDWEKGYLDQDGQFLTGEPSDRVSALDIKKRIAASKKKSKGKKKK